jgi:hypothetical protein
MSTNPQRLTLRSARAALAGLLFLAACGCGGSGGKGTVTGTVTLDGQPLPAGKIAFMPAEGAGVSADIRDGAYTATDVPTGEVKVIVETHSLKPLVDQAKGAAPKWAPKGVGAPKMPASTPAAGTQIPPEAKEYFEKQQRQAAEAAQFAKDLAARFRPVPDRYGDPSRSGLSFTVKSGNNTYDVPLSSK